MEKRRSQKEITMSTRKSMFALAAIATLATSALVPTSASAHFGGFRPAWGHVHVGFGHFHLWPTHPGCLNWSWCRWHPHYRFGGFAPTVVSGSPTVTSAPASAPSAPTGGCLSKRELPDGDALFKDRCTGEQAESQPQGSSPGGH
jgi:hypothetical protein